MRTLILLMTGVFSLIGTAQQNELAFLSISTLEAENTISESIASVPPNLLYLKELLSNQSSDIIKKCRERLANYNLKSNSVYDDSEKAMYSVVFRNKQVNIIANYESDGSILYTQETYKGIRIPKELMVKISKVYPGWAFSKTTYHLSYNRKEGIDNQFYKIQISNGKKKKILRFNENFKAI
ncbi:hypothetical protein ACGK9U_14410 [Mariniflexile sp. HNIBRBA6329]|uniref:hypothetical protein n=1 Tax=Mariniflexile sp. HNIBRBA6329 TaxID=3373088 RepID=UPI0037460D4D